MATRQGAVSDDAGREVVRMASVDPRRRFSYDRRAAIVAMIVVLARR